MVTNSLLDFFYTTYCTINIHYLHCLCFVGSWHAFVSRILPEWCQSSTKLETRLAIFNYFSFICFMYSLQEMLKINIHLGGRIIRPFVCMFHLHIYSVGFNKIYYWEFIVKVIRLLLVLFLSVWYIVRLLQEAQIELKFLEILHCWK
jgi:hypothetical protein